jgi:hypothetical protein
MNNSDHRFIYLPLIKSGIGTPVYIINDSLINVPSKIIDTVLITERRKKFFDDLKLQVRI